MKVLIIYAHPNPMSFTKAILDNFVRGLKEAGHQYEIVDLYKIKFNPVFQVDVELKLIQVDCYEVGFGLSRHFFYPLVTL